MFRRFFVVVPMLTAAAIGHANDQERAEVMQLIHALESARPLIERAEHAADPYDPYQVDYQAVHLELNTMINGLKEVIDLPRREPRHISPAYMPVVEGRYVP